VKLAGLYDPAENGLSIDMWSYSNGKEIKNTYMPDKRCVIEEKADMGSLIFVRSRYTGLSCIVCLL